MRLGKLSVLFHLRQTIIKRLNDFAKLYQLAKTPIG